VTHAEHAATEPATGSGAVVSTHPSFGSAGNRVGSRGGVQVKLAIACCLLLLSAASTLSTAAATADSQIGGLTGPHSGQLGNDNPGGVAVSDREGGDLYVADRANNRIDQFQPDGTFVRAFGWNVALGAASGAGNLSIGSTTIATATTDSGRFVPGQIISGDGIPPNTEITQVGSGSLTISNPATAAGPDVPLEVAAAPGHVSTNELQTLSVTATAGNFTLTFSTPEPSSTSQTTANIPYNASAAEVEGALAALGNLGAGNVAVSSANSGGVSGVPGGPYEIEFKGTRFTDTDVGQLQVGAGTPALSGGSAAVTTTKQGAGALESCTTLCAAGESGSQPGQLAQADALAVDNDPTSSSYGDVYVIDQRNFRVEKFGPEGQFELFFGGEVDKGPHHPGNLCTAENLTEGDRCGAGVSGISDAHFYKESPGTAFNGSAFLSWDNGAGASAAGYTNSIAVGPDGTVYVGDYDRVQEFGPDGSFAGQRNSPYAQMISGVGLDPGGSVHALFAGNDEAQKVVPPASGSYTLSFEGEHTGSIPSSAGYQQIAAELDKLLALHNNIEVQETPSPGVARLRFKRVLADRNLPTIVASAGSVETLTNGATAKVAKLGPAGEVLQAFDTEAGSEPSHLAIAANGDVLVSEFKQVQAPPPSGEASRDRAAFKVFDPVGTLAAEFTSAKVENLEERISEDFTRTTQNPLGIAFGTGSNGLYATTSRWGPNFPFPEIEAYIAAIPLPEPGPPQVEEERVTDIEPETATLHALVNPKQFDTHYHFEYTTTDFTACGEPVNPHCFKTPEPPAGLGSVDRMDPVQAALSGLMPETVYRWRVVAESECEPVANPGHICVTAPEEELTTLPPVSVRDFTTQLVAPEEVVFKAELSPDNSLSPTGWEICYGENTSYTGGCVSGELHVHGNEFEEVRATFTGLQPNTPYHYRLTAENEFGQTKTADATLTTEPSPAEERAAEDCPANGSVHGTPGGSTLREENNSLALPDCRAYEQVSPPYKAGNPVVQEAEIAPEGERVLFASNGVFAGAAQNIVIPTPTQYLAQRAKGGWLSRAVVGNPAGSEFVPGFAPAFTPALDSWVFPEAPALSAEPSFQSPASARFYAGYADGTFAQASPLINRLETDPSADRAPIVRLGAAADSLSRLFVYTSVRELTTGDSRPSDPTNTTTRIYEVARAAGSTPTMSLVAEVPIGLGVHPGECYVSPDGAGFPARRTSSDGYTIVYTSPIMVEPGGCGDKGPNPYGIFARIGGAAPILLNAKLASECHSPSPCASAQTTTPSITGVSPDGSRVWFTTTQPLVDSDTDSTSDLYLAKLENGTVSELVQASGGGAGDPHPGEGADLQRIFQFSGDGSHTAFLATGVLTTEPNQLGQSAAQGADNLYVFDAGSGETKFVARLCKAPSESGSLPDPRCPNPGGSETQSQRLTPDGSFLLFTSFARLTADDTDNVQDLYRYDFATEQLIRLSIGRDGNDANGNDNAFPAELPELGRGLSLAVAPDVLAEDSGRSISADGSRAIFTTAAPLVSSDTNEAPDLYEWEEQGHGPCAEAGGCLRLVSDGVDRHGIGAGYSMSPSGRDIAFSTPRGLVPDDTDGLADIYDAREGGGFPVATPPHICEGAEGCHGKATEQTLHPSFTSEETRHGPEEGHLKCAKTRHRVKKHGEFRCVPNYRKKHHHHKRSHRRAGAKRGGHK
jgi:hypothetical protein